MEAKEMVEGLVGRALGALAEFETLDQERVDHVVKKASLAALAAHGELARLAVEETGRGLFEDKAVKNLFACEHVTNSMAGLRTAGVISRDELNGITEIAEPVGVVCAMTPVTNPTSTTVFKALIALKTRNPIVFAFHPSAQHCSAGAARIVRDAAVAAGAPADCVQWIEEPSMEATGLLMHHDGVSTILATGGNAMVKAAYSCGKPALGVGAGNVPAYVAKDAKLRRAIHDIVLSKAFDNGMICASEQAVILDAEVYEEGIAEFERLGAHVVTAAEKTKLEEYLFGTTAYGSNCGGAGLNAAVVGKSPVWIAEQAGFEVPEGTSILLAECAEVGENEPLTREKLSPVLAALKAGSTEQGIEMAAAMVEFHGLGHSAAIHTEDEALAEEFGRRVKAVR
ncbi:aldehyde dehydrogenase family protein, partial [Streptomyces hydrogenans]